jgi:HTH-type transcriptional regulator/antitoxin HigA
MEGAVMIPYSQIETAWKPLSPFISVPHNETEYRRLVEFLDELTDEVGENENHHLASLMELVGTLIEKYEDENVPELA